MKRLVAAALLWALLFSQAWAQTPLCRNGGSGSQQCAGSLGSVVSIHLPSGTTWTGGRYLGVSGETPSASATSGLVPWCAPVSGTAKYLNAQAVGTLSPGSTVTAYKSSSGALSFSSTALAVTVAIFTYAQRDTTHTVSLSAGDCLVFGNDITWSPGGLEITFLFVPG